MKFLHWQSFPVNPSGHTHWSHFLGSEFVLPPFRQGEGDSAQSALGHVRSFLSETTAKDNSKVKESCMSLK